MTGLGTARLQSCDKETVLRLGFSPWDPAAEAVTEETGHRTGQPVLYSHRLESLCHQSLRCHDRGQTSGILRPNAGLWMTEGRGGSVGALAFRPVKSAHDQLGFSPGEEWPT